jgi:tetratricopeptide (TPR) repeat protein
MRRQILGLLTALLLGAGGCAATAPHDARSPAATLSKAPVRAVAVSDEAFSRQATAVLASGKFNQQRLNLLAGVVRRQLDRANSRFNNGHTDAGLAALTGAMYLLRAGEHPEAIFKDRTSALGAAAAEVARTGDEGRAFALYQILSAVLPAGSERAEVAAHLAALRRWTKATRASGPMQAVSAKQRMAVDRSLFEATLPALRAAAQSTRDWINSAIDLSNRDQPLSSDFNREESIAAYRAIRSGGATFVALFLRHGDAAGAYNGIEEYDLVRVIPPVLRQPLERIVVDADPAGWSELFRLFNEAAQAERPQAAIDAKLAEAAAWGSALELYRSDPTSMAAAMALALLLPHYGMAEVAPTVLARALSTQPRPNDVSFCMALVLRAIIAEDEIGELGAARRTFGAASPIIKLAESPRLAGQVHPNAARLRYVMGALETRAGQLARARPHIEAVVKVDPNPDALGLLAAIDRQRGALPQALASLGRVVTLARTTGSRTAEAEAWVTAFEIHRERGAPREARAALRAALDNVLVARKLALNTPAHARTERLLARVLEHYGDLRGAQRATQRAYDASTADLDELAATVLDAARRALTRGDLSAARDAVRRALDSGLEDEDVVYVALWLKLLERRLGLPPDGTVEEAFAVTDKRTGWSAKLRAWGRGKLDDGALLKAARNRVERTEAVFYTAMTMKPGSRAELALQQVASSEAIELVEVVIARELLAQPSAKLELMLPADIDLP